MEMYLLKSAACLAIFFLFYKVFLENASFHHIKRGYLLGSLLVAFSIPFITFTTYVAPIAVTNAPVFFETTVVNTSPIIVEEPFNYLQLLWVIYGAGVLFFGFRFFQNLFKIQSNIKHNEKITHGIFFHILLKDFVAPHTFFHNIFFHKKAYDEGSIPAEVLWHEETHAEQKHSIDILIIELLQVAFWFNPFIYLFKNSIKLNHEFLADREVVKRQQDTIGYQQILLNFSQNATSPELANAINYSSFKKRFTVMKTHTSKRATLLKVLLVLPVLALLIYGFSQKEEVIISTSETSNIQNDGTLNVIISENEELTFNGKKVEMEKISEEIKGKKFDNVDINASSKVSIPFGKNLLETINNAKVSKSICYKVHDDKGLDTNYMAHIWGFEDMGGRKVFALTIKDNIIFLKGEVIQLSSLKDKINAITKGWSTEEYTNSNPNFLVTQTDPEFLEKVNQEFQKTNFSKNKNGLTLKQYPKNKVHKADMEKTKSWEEKFGDAYDEGSIDTQKPSLFQKEQNKFEEKGYTNGTVSTSANNDPYNIIVNRKEFTDRMYTTNPSGMSTNKDKKYNQSIKVSVEEEKIYLNDKLVDLSDFANKLNKTTSKWKIKDFELYGLNVQLKNVPEDFITKVNREYRKSELAKKSSSDNPRLIDVTFPPPPPATPESPTVFKNLSNPLPTPALLKRTENGTVEVRDLSNTINAKKAMKRARSSYTKKSQEDYAKEYMEGAARNDQKAFVLQIALNNIKFNGVTVPLNRLAKTIDAYTKDWEDSDYTAAQPSVLVASTPKEFLDKVDTEFRKTNYSKANGGMNIVPPPPPAPPSPFVKKGEKSNIPPPPPPSPKVMKGEKSNIPPPPPPSQEKSLFKGRVLKELPADEPNIGYYYKDKLIPRTEAALLVYNDKNLRFTIREAENNRSIVTILEKNDLPPPPPAPKVLKGEKSNIPPPPAKPNDSLASGIYYLKIFDDTYLDINKMPAKFDNLTYIIKKINKQGFTSTTANISANADVKMATIIDVKEILTKNGVTKFIMQPILDSETDKDGN